MLDKAKEVIKSWSTTGLHWPFVHDPETQQASSTLLFFYMLGVCTVGTVIALHFDTQLWIATSGVLVAWCLSFVFYRIRKLDKFTLDLQNKKIELDGADEPDKKT